MGYGQRVEQVEEVFAVLEDEVLGDMEGLQGVFWWEGLPLTRNLLIADYAIGLTHAVRSNLSTASMHLARHRELQEWTDAETLKQAHLDVINGRNPGAPTSEEFDDRRIEMRGHFAGFLRALGSTVDCLGSLVVVTTGMNLAAVTSSWSGMLNWAKDPKPTHKRRAGLSPTHQAMVDDVVREVQAAVSRGPRDWLDWSLDYRHTIVHRAPRFTVTLFAERRQNRLSHPLPAHPDQTHAEWLIRGHTFSEMLDGRETLDTLELLFTTLVTLTEDVGRICIKTWTTRRQDVDLHVQPEGLWPDTTLGRERHFDGAGTTVPMPSASALALNPRARRRFQLTRMLDDDLHVWSELPKPTTIVPAPPKAVPVTPRGEQPRRRSRSQRSGRSRFS